jgi:iron-sulfur cluster repair protein YtfE (RIC family)
MSNRQDAEQVPKGRPRTVTDPNDLTPTQVRNRVIAQHDFLRGELADLQQLADAVKKGNVRNNVSRLKARVTEFLSRLEQHMAYEELVLEPMLLEMDPARPTLVERMREDHLEQRALFRAFIEDLQGDGPEGLAQHVRELAQNLFHDIEIEERVLLNPDILRDDSISISQEDG